MAEAVKEEKNVNTMSEEQIADLQKKYYGLTDKDIEELMVFVDEFDEVASGVSDNPTYDDLKPVVDSGNKIPSHCGFMIMSYYENRNGENALIKLMEQLYSVFKSLNEEDPESTKTTDLYETLACVIMFSQHNVVRKFITRDFERAKDVVKIMRKRPAVASVLMSCLSELYITTKDNQKYMDCIVDNLKQMLAFLETKNGITPEVPDAINVNFNNLRDIMADYLDKGNKRESLTQINNLINKKADIGQAFFDWVAIGPSVACRVIEASEEITGEMITAFVKQMKIQHVVELHTLMMNYLGEKLNTSILYVKDAYGLETADDYYEKMQSIIQRGGLYHYGILLRHTELMPKIDADELPSADSISSLRRKLSTIENNLTADISQKSMSITIAPLSRSRIYQDIYDKLEGIEADEDEGSKTNSFVAKLRDKNIVKKIREAGLSYFAMDQYSGSIVIKALEAMLDVLNKGKDMDRKTFITEVYKESVLKYKTIQTLEYFRDMCDILFNDNEAEDYEEIEA